MPEYEDDQSDSNEWAPSLDSDFGVPIMWTPREKKALILANEKRWRSSRERNPDTQISYNEYMAHHYGFTMKVAAEQDPKCTSRHHRREGEELKLPGKAEESRKPDGSRRSQKPNRTSDA